MKKTSPKPVHKTDASPKRDQSIRFIEAAKAAGADETGKEFERAFKKIVQPKKRAKAK